MPSHYTKKEWEERQRRAEAKAKQPQQLSFFESYTPVAHPMTERIHEYEGHHYLHRCWGNHEEVSQID